MKDVFSLETRIFRILQSANHGFFRALMTLDKNAVIQVFYEEPNHDKKEFFNLDTKRKVIEFYQDSKSSLTQKEVSDLVISLKKKGYNVKGECCLERKFRKNEISLY